MKRKPHNTIIIDLGNGVKMAAPFKRTWTLAEWRRMTKYIDACIGNVKPKGDIEAYK
ncbi:hypothetical protein JXA12_00805 [Candidatus Woesearchaeota archaeon]|nr:hypothetical protein [Candidatus Woesearchaeota archaeon]